MIEVMVALLVLSIGLLGLALLQVKALANNNGAMARSMATIYSYSIIDAMRIDQSNLSSYETTVTADDCPDAGATLASAQLNQWCVSLADSLGPVNTTKGVIDCDDGECTVTISFDDSHAGLGGSGTQTIVTKVAL